MKKSHTSIVQREGCSNDMRLLLVNSVCGIRSTGRIVADIAKEHEAKGWEVRIGYGRIAYVPGWCKKWAVRIGNRFDLLTHVLITRLWGDHSIGLCSRRATKRFLEWAERYNPDVLWLHNIHGYYLNVEMLFDWIKSRPNMQVKWTIHDCSAFTGRCGYFERSGCQQWKTECIKCPVECGYKSYFLLGGPGRMFRANKRAYLGVKNMTLITVSNWLAGLVRQSFLGGYPIEVHRNKVDRSVFKPTPSDFRNKMGLFGKKIILGVASTWEERKGLADFVRLATLLPDEWVIVLVGLSAKQIRKMPAKIIGLGKTNSIEELAGLYTTADVFFNPSLEETFSMVNAEACSCGTKVITYDSCAMPESVEGFDNAIVLHGADKAPEGFLRALRAKGGNDR